MSKYCQAPKCSRKTRGFAADPTDLTDKFCPSHASDALRRIRVADPDYFTKTEGGMGHASAAPDWRNVDSMGSAGGALYSS